MKIGYTPFAIALILTAAVTGIVGGQFASSQRAKSGCGSANGCCASDDLHPSTEDIEEFERFLESNPPANLLSPVRSRPKWKEECGPQNCDAKAAQPRQQVVLDAPPAEDDEYDNPPAVIAKKPGSNAAQVGLEGEGPQLGSGGVPDQLPHPDDAAPIDGNQDKVDQQTREIIAQELPSATSEERDVWFDELKGLPAQMVRELLRLRGKIAPDLADINPNKPKLPHQGMESSRTSTVTLPNGPGPQTYPPNITSQTAMPAIDSSIIATRTARDVVLNNIANAQTPGFQRSRVLFEDLGYRQMKMPGQQDLNGHHSATDFSVGFGVQISGVERDTTPGTIEASKSELHIAIVGSGYFQAQDGADLLYTRAGTFALNSAGQVVLASARRSRLLEPAITIPPDATNVEISDEGIVSVRQPGSSSLTPVGQVQIARFVNAAGLEPRGENLFASTDASGASQAGSPGLEGRGKLRQRYLEASNVNVDDELAELQRLQSRLVVLEKARAVLFSSIDPTTVPSSRIAESIPR